MECRKCGNEVVEGDIFCQNCGVEVEIDTQIECNTIPVTNEESIVTKESGNEETVTNEVRNQEETKKKSGKSKKKLIIMGVIFCIGVLAYLGMQPRDIEMEFEELYEVMNSSKIKDYYGDNITVKGNLYRSPEYVKDDGLYVLTSSDKEDEINMIFFTIGEKSDFIDEELGKGSELMLKGKLGELTASEIPVLIVDEIIVKKKVERVYDVTDIETLNSEYNNYINKKVTFSGKLVIPNMSGAYVSDDESANSVWLHGISDKELLEYQEKGPWCEFTGKFYKDGNKLALEVESITYNDYTDMMNDEELSKIEYSVDEVYRNSEKLMNKEISVRGLLSMDSASDGAGNPISAFHNETIDKYVILKGKKVNAGNCEAVITGTLSIRDDGNLVLDVHDYEVTRRFSMWGVNEY